MHAHRKLTQQYAQADGVYDRAGAFIDALIGRASAVLEKTAVIRASSFIFARHFALVADHLSNPTKAYTIIETVRGRVAADLVRSGAVASADAKRTERGDFTPSPEAHGRSYHSRSTQPS